MEFLCTNVGGVKKQITIILCTPSALLKPFKYLVKITVTLNTTL